MKINLKSISHYFEKFKTILLVFLIVLCVVQVGILWSTQSRSFPFLSSLFSDSKTTSLVTVEDSKAKYLLPSKIVLSTAFDGDHIIIPNGSKEYVRVWEGAKWYISHVLDARPQKIQSFNEKVWGRISASKPYMLEFKTAIPIDIVKWVLNLKPSAGGGLSSIYKIIVCPADPVTGENATVYIRDDKNIYTFVITDSKNSALGSDEFTDIYTNLKENTNAKNYQSAAEKWEDTNISKDMFGPMLENTGEDYPSITCTTFSGMDESDANNYKYEDYERIASELFGKSSSNYDYDTDINGSVVFKKTDIVYRLYRNSVLEYKYMENQTSTYDLRLLDAYKKAIEFIIDINRQNNFLSNVNVYLSFFEKKSNSYIFKFDYGIVINDKYGEVPVLLKDYAIAKGMDNLDSCISIEANSKRVTHCEMIPLKFKSGKMSKYEWAFTNMYQKEFEEYPELNKKDISVKNFGIYYVMSNNVLKKHIDPSFVLYTADDNYVVPLK